MLRLSNEYYISFVLFPQALEPSMNFNIPKMVHCTYPSLNHLDYHVQKVKLF